jgi:endosialidase-like protein
LPAVPVEQLLSRKEVTAKDNVMRSLSPAALLLVVSLLGFPGKVAAADPTRFLQFSAVLNRVQAPGIAGVRFAVYRDQEGGEPLWSETQNVEADEKGRFSVVLGEVQRIPLEIFTSGEARWLGIQRIPEAEQQRILLAAVPYALKAADADTLGGKPLSAFVLAEPAQERGDGDVIGRPWHEARQLPIVGAPQRPLSLDQSIRSLQPIPNAAVTTGFQLASITGNTSIGFATTGGAWNVYLKPSSASGFDSTDLRMTLADSALTLTGALSLGGNINIASGAAIVKGLYRFLHSVGTSSTFVGLRSGTSTNTGARNTGVGEDALGAITTAGGNTAVGNSAFGAITDGNENTAVGSQAGKSLAGNANTLLGSDVAFVTLSGSYNTMIGTSAFFPTASGSNNIGLGYAAGYNLSSGDNNIYIGSVGPAAQGPESGKIRIGDPSQTATFIAGINGVTSSGGVAVYVNSSGQLGTLTSSIRYKENVEDMGTSSGRLMELRPVTFQYKPEYDESGLQQYGLIAEEVAKVDPQLVVYDADGTPQTVRYHFINAMLLNEVQKQHRQIEDQQAMIDQLAARLAKLETTR